MLKINSQLKLFVLALCLFFLSFESPARAWIEDFSTWSAVFVQGKFEIDSKWGLFLEAQNRSAQSTANLNRLLVRAAIRNEISPGLFLFAGYGWTPNLSPFRNENRLWQQVQTTVDIGSQKVMVRFRQEQRWIERTNTLSHRSRVMVKNIFSILENVPGLSVWDELFVNWNSIVGGSARGFDQNRLFVGPAFSFGPHVSVEVGYMNLAQRRPTSSEGMMAHTLMFNTFVSF